MALTFTDCCRRLQPPHHNHSLDSRYVMLFRLAELMLIAVLFDFWFSRIEFTGHGSQKTFQEPPSRFTRRGKHFEDGNIANRCNGVALSDSGDEETCKDVKDEFTKILP